MALINSTSTFHMASILIRRNFSQAAKVLPPSSGSLTQLTKRQCGIVQKQTVGYNCENCFKNRTFALKTRDLQIKKNGALLRCETTVNCVILRSYHSQLTTSQKQMKEPKDNKLTTRRIVKRKRSRKSTAVDEEVFDINAFATCEELDLESLTRDLKKDGLYAGIPLPPDCEDAIHVEAVYKVNEESREMFFFREGAVVFWNVPEVERNLVLRRMYPHQESSFDPDLVQCEQERVQYMFSNSETTLVGDDIKLKTPQNAEDRTSHQLEKYTFSNVLVLSVKLAVWEASLANYVESIEYVLDDLRAGKKLKISRREVLQKTGELLNLRHLINLSSDLLDIPDFYWNREEELELLYKGIQRQLNMGKRVKVMNEKLNHCCELMELLREQLNDKHHIKLEWLIIFLIGVEVVFEIMRMAGISH